MWMIIKGLMALIAFVATTWCIYAAIVGIKEALRKDADADIKCLTIGSSILAFLLGILLAWLGCKILI